MTYAGGVVCRGCHLMAARWRITLPAGRELLRCGHCAERVKEQSPGATVVALPPAPVRTRQLALPVGEP